MRGVDVRQQGFTLVELLLALSISALVATLAYAGISTAIDASAGMQAEVRRLAELQRALNIIEEDLAQVVPRAIVNGYGSDSAAFSGGRYQEALLEFTRGGLGNPQELARSELQRVRYVLDGGNLWRQWWTAVDRADESRAPESALLIEGVASVDVVFLAPPTVGAAPLDYYMLATSAALWDSDWSSARLAPDTVAPLPIAVDLHFTLVDFGEVRRVVEIP
jgi:general secretion pathway protein J